MLRSITNTNEGHITSWYPNVWAPKLVLSIEFHKGFNDYLLFDYINGRTVTNYRVLDNGQRIDLQ
jgi:hypothetical protein